MDGDSKVDENGNTMYFVAMLKGIVCGLDKVNNSSYVVVETRFIKHTRLLADSYMSPSTFLA